MHQLLTGLQRVGGCTAGVEQTEEVVDLRRRPYGTSRILIGCLLLDGNDWRQTGNLIYVRPLQVTDIASGIRGEGLQVAPISLCVDSIKGEG